MGNVLFQIMSTSMPLIPVSAYSWHLLVAYTLFLLGKNHSSTCGENQRNRCMFIITSSNYWSHLFRTLALCHRIQPYNRAGGKINSSRFTIHDTILAVAVVLMAYHWHAVLRSLQNTRTVKPVISGHHDNRPTYQEGSHCNIPAKPLHNHDILTVHFNLFFAVVSIL